MLSDKSPCISSGATRFRSKACGICAKFERQLFGYDIAPVHVGYRHFCRRDKKEIVVFTLKASSSNFGNCPVPVMLALFTINGGNISVYPLAVCVSSIKLYIERSSLAPKPLYTVNLAPLILQPSADREY